MSDREIAEILKTIIKRSKATIEMIKTQFDQIETPGPTNLAKILVDIQ